MGRRTGVGQADEDDLWLHAKVLGARVQRRLERVPRVQAAAHMLTPCQILYQIFGCSPGLYHASGHAHALRCAEYFVCRSNHLFV